MEDTGCQSPYPTLLTILKHRARITQAGAALMFILTCWIAFRTGMPDLYIVAVLVAVILYFVLRAAIEVVDLVAETLMPR